MDVQIKSKLEYLKKILKNFEEYKIKFEIGRNSSQIISELLTIDFFEKYIEKLKQIGQEDVHKLKEGNATRTSIINAQKILFSIIENTINVMEKTILYANSNTETNNNIKIINQINTIINFFSNSSFSYDELASSLELSDFEQVFVSKDKTIGFNKDNLHGLYKSYFSEKALQNIQEHIYFGKIPDIKKKYLTVLFIDIVGFSTMSEYIDPAKIMQLLNYFFNEVNTTIMSYKGDIDKFIGDAMLVTFDNAEDAVRSAIKIVNHDLEVINSKLEYMNVPEVKVHVGLNTDWVVQGDVGSNLRRETTVIGDGVNIAARVQSLSPPNELWLTANTVASIGKLRWDMENLGKHKVKGRSQEVTIYRHQGKSKGIISLLLYEPNKDLQTTIHKQMDEAGIKNVIIANTKEEFKSKLMNDNVKVLTMGPTIDSIEMKEIIEEAEKIKKIKMPIIPILKKNLDDQTNNFFEKLGVKLHVNMQNKNGMKKINRVMASEEARITPKLKEQIKPDEVNEIVKVGISDHPSPEEIKSIESASEKIEDVKLPDVNPEPIIPKATTPKVPLKQDEPKIEEKAVETKKDSIADMKKEIQRKTTLSLIGKEMKIIAKDIISLDSFSQLKQDVSNLYKFSSQKDISLFIINMEAISHERIDEEQVENYVKILNFMPDPKKVRVKFEFPNNQPVQNWEEIKGFFKFQFLN
ncbi:MAG: adenylate/guanylate cyclase domain-containing protein [Spirochaetota bacterium]|nr:adenylate/guanylate cyclase domain-containing protein [Spirochaetota bacterium]